MKKVIFKNWQLVLILVFASVSLISCGSDDNEPPMVDSTPTPDPTPDPISDPVVINFGLSTVGGAFPNQTTYVQGLTDLDFTTIGNNQATELAANGGAGTVSYNKALYTSPFGAPATLVKYVFDDDGNTVEEERIVVPGANVFSTLYFESETVAYGSVAGGISKLIVFNPTTMRITGEVSLNSVTSRFPEATRTYYLDMMERDDKLFMGVHYENNFVPVNDSAYVAVIDLNSRTVEKILSDNRTGMVFGGQAANTGMVKAENGDIYVQGLGTTLSGGASPSGLLKIANGQTDFDSDYFMDMEAATGNVCYGVNLMPSGRAFTSKVEDENDFFEFQTGEPQFTYYEIDILNGTGIGAVPGLPTTYGSRGMIIRPLDGEELLFTNATNDENAVYSFDGATNSASKKFVSTGGYINGLETLN
ncbi:DUF4374 domain-containing protein [Allomuricauda sp. R78024]|uniref:DUF4374 domain-containing protein n=1 Tax=Allomuricauda sp. R78024 TaxID=3093867 RepID=UPI0037CA1E34